jgi:4'-phosphopantetheinyl transferase
VRQFCYWKGRQLVLFGKLLLLDAINDSEFTWLSLHSFTYTKFNRPYLDETLDFNISHSGDYVICVISRHVRVGIDVEELKPIDIWDFRKQYTEEEWNSIVESGNRYKQFYRYWTWKEAVMKADGSGLSIPLDHLDVIKNPATLGSNLWFLNEIFIDDTVMVHLATNQPVGQKDIHLEQRAF